MDSEDSLPQSQVPYNCAIFSQLNPFHITASHFLRIHLNIILPSTAGSSKLTLSFMIPHHKTCIRLSSPSYSLHGQPISIFLIFSPVQYFVKLHIIKHLFCSFLHSPLNSSRLGPNIHFYNLYLLNVFTNYISYTWEIYNL